MDQTDLSPIAAQSADGDQLRLGFDEPQEHRVMPGVIAVVAWLVNDTTGEVREQTVYFPFRKGWRETAARRMARGNSYELVPQKLISHETP